MNVVVCLKEVPGRDTRYQLTSDGCWIDTSEITWEAGECDEYALEEALKLRETCGGEVVILTLGPERAEKSMRKGLAMGADRGILVVDEQRRAASPMTVAAALKQVVSDETFDLILAGTQSDDFGSAQTGVILAELLGLPHATIVMEIQAQPSQKRIRVLREMESGWFQWVELPTPSLLTVQAGSSPVRYPSLKGIMGAKKKEIRKVSLEELQLDWDSIPAPEIVELFLPERTSRVQMLEGDTETAVNLLIEKLQTEAKVL